MFFELVIIKRFSDKFYSDDNTMDYYGNGDI